MTLTAFPTSKMTCRLFSIFFCFLTILLQHATTTSSTSTLLTGTSSAGNETDLLALLAFKSKITPDPQGVLSSWNNSLHFCKWEGVTCGRRHDRVTVLDLHSRQLVGHLSPFIGNLSFLRVIRLYNNTLQGEIPQEFGRLSRLQILLLFTNSLSGELPANLSQCSNLMILSIGYNKLTGKIPPEMGSLSNLQKISIPKCYLSGVITSFLGNNTSLSYIAIPANLLEGKIPDTLGKLKSLTYLALAGNKMSGMIPPSTYNLSLINVFSLADNELYGSLPPDLFLTLPNLQWLQINGNQFSGPIPVSLSNASEIEDVQMQQNNFTGKVSTDFGGLHRLQTLLLWSNNLGEGEADEMDFLHSLTNCSNLKWLQLSDNQFRGMLPNSMSNLSKNLRYVTLSENQLFGVIPSGLGYLVNLIHLALHRNRFTGEIPSEISNLQKLQGLSLKENRLSGKIPFSLGNLPFLSHLYLQINRLQGPIPSTLGNLQQLLMLKLSQNNFTGTIPHQFFAMSSLFSLNLDKNSFIGSLPPYVGNLTNLVELDLSGNKLSGEIPSELGNCLGLEILYMEDNFFHGPIPPSLSSLRGITYLDLSSNNLSGQIPKYLENFPLMSLNLSFNNFEGEVPTKGIFSNASAISFAGNNRLCGGIYELKLPKCNVKGSKKGKMSRALLLAVPIASALVASISVSMLCCFFMKRRKEQQVVSLLKESIPKVSYQDLLKATDGFSSDNLIGVGSFGSVYKGILDETAIAIKVLDLQRQGASKSFIAECEALRNIRHRNLVKVLTSCSSVDFQGNEFKAIVYEFMSNGNLERWLHQTSENEHGQDELQNLHLLQRINIAIDVACALDYIHHHCQMPIIHCDLKPSNILLDNNMTAHVGDFGLAKFLPELTNVSQASSSGIRGTIGYVAPEYGIRNEPSIYGDVYSYGVLLLEMITGKRPTDNMFMEGLNLHNFVKMALPDRVMEVVDRKLISTIGEKIVDTTITSIQSQTYLRNGCKSEECLRTLAKIGVACSVEAPLQRMDINKVVSDLHSLRDILLQNGVRRQAA